MLRNYLLGDASRDHASKKIFKVHYYITKEKCKIINIIKAQCLLKEFPVSALCNGQDRRVKGSQYYYFLCLAWERLTLHNSEHRGLFFTYMNVRFN